MIAAKSATEVCRLVPPDDAARSLLREQQTPRQYLDALIAAGQLAYAVRFLAAALAKREAVWWACQCSRMGYEKAAPAPAIAALTAAEKWVADPSDANRRAAFPASEASGVGTPAGAAAVAAFFSGGSVAPANLPAVPPGDQLTAMCAAAAVQLAAVLSQPEKADEKFRRFLALGFDVASGANRWKEPNAAPVSGTRR